MALQNYMNELMEESGAETIVVITDDVTHLSLEKHASLRRSQQIGSPPARRRNSKLSQESGDSPSMCQLRRDSSGSIQPSLVSMNESPLRGQFCYNKRMKGELLQEINQLPMAEQRLPRSHNPTIKRKPCIFEPTDEN